MADPATATPIKHRLLGRNFGVESFKFNRWSAELDEGQTLQDALQPSFWAEQSTTLMGHDPANPRGRGDIIVLRQLSTGLVAELIVREIGKGFIKVEVLRNQEAAAVVVPEGPLEPKWNVGRRAFDVVRKGGEGADKQVMSSGHQTKEAAVRWIVEHTKAMAA